MKFILFQTLLALAAITTSVFALPLPSPTPPGPQGKAPAQVGEVDTTNAERPHVAAQKKHADKTLKDAGRGLDQKKKEDENKAVLDKMMQNPPFVIPGMSGRFQ